MFFRNSGDKIHTQEVIKWGVFSGFLQGLFLALLTILYAKRQLILDLSGGWEYGAALFLMALFAVGGIVTTIIIFGHPIYCLLRGHYRDALLTVMLSLAVILVMAGFAFWAMPLLQESPII
jgi:hypothetical protein